MGVCVALVELMGCRPADESDSEAACLEPPRGWYCWELRLIRELPAIPVSGVLGLFRPPDAVARAAAE
jgi:hypothetical protein